MLAVAASWRRFLAMLLVASPGLAVQSLELNALQTAMSLNKATPGASPVPQASAAQGKEFFEAALLRVAYLEGLASKQDKKLSKLRFELTGDAGPSAGDKDIVALPTSSADLNTKIASLERRLQDRSAATQQLLAATKAALDKGAAAKVPQVPRFLIATDACLAIELTAASADA
eukprot:CAMPEP_0117475438 /NCGR_PEP_ID=MMETSP0784-20121206/9795_1 /TAXON_ID=39447 /ORGANISM="" /LENGTH=173 /DNA_ID=CAMNT_0005269685 /DNA_START=100 /DNA_END=622 /DNA_ORIENTATION=-